MGAPTPYQEQRLKKIRSISQKEVSRNELHRMESVIFQKLSCLKLGIPRSVQCEAIHNFFRSEADCSSSLHHHFDLRDNKKIDNIVKVVREQCQELLLKRKLQEQEQREQEQKQKEARQTIPQESRIANTTTIPSTGTAPTVLKNNKLEGQDPWVVMSVFNKMEADSAIKAEHDKAVKNQKVMAERLDEQIKEKKQLEENMKMEDLAFEEKQRKKAHDWAREQELLSIRERQKSEDLRKAREVQLNVRKQRRKAASQEKRASELAEIEHNRIALLKEEEGRRAKIEEEKRRLDAIKVENAENEKRRQKVKEEEAAVEAKMMKDYKNKMDLQEQRRVEAFNARVERYKIIAQNIENSDFTKEEKQKQIDIERKILQEALAKEKTEEAREIRDRKMLVEKKKQINDTNRRMTEERRRQEILNKKAEEAYREEYRRRVQTTLEEENQKQLRRDEQERLYAERLKEQIQEQEKFYKEAPLMNGVEQSLNREVLKRIENDAEVQEKLMKRLLATKGSEKNMDAYHT